MTIRPVSNVEFWSHRMQIQTMDNEMTNYMLFFYELKVYTSDIQPRYISCFCLSDFHMRERIDNCENKSKL